MKRARLITAFSLVVVAPLSVISYLNDASLKKLQAAVISSQRTQIEPPDGIIARYDDCVSGYIYAPHILHINGQRYFGIERNDIIFAHFYADKEILKVHQTGQDSFQNTPNQHQHADLENLDRVLAGAGGCKDQNLYVASLEPHPPADQD